MRQSLGDKFEQHTIFNSQTFFCRGMRSAQYPGAATIVNRKPVQPYMQQLTNWRIGLPYSVGPLTVRAGVKKLTSAAPVANASFRGAWSGFIQGTLYILGAYRVSGETRIYSLDPSTFAWTELTGTTGPYGNTRFTTDGWCSFACMKAVEGYDALVIQNGTDSPRVYSPAFYIGPGTNPMSIHATVSAPLDSTSTNVSLKLIEAVKIWEGGTRTGYLTYANSGGGLSLADTGAKETLSSKLTVTAGGTAVNATTQWQITSNFSCANSRQLLMIVSTTWGSMWENIKVSISNDNATYVTIYDPTTQSPIFVENVDPNDASCYLVGFSLDGVSASDKATAAFTTTKYVRLTYVGVVNPTAGQTATIRMIALSGVIPGGASYVASMASRYAFMESSGLFLKNVFTQDIRGDSTSNISGSPGANGLNIPSSPLIYYKPYINYVTPSQAQLNLGVDSVFLYRQDDGETDFTFTGAYSFSGWSGAAWTGTPDLATSLIDIVLPPNKNPARLAPGVFQLPIQIGNSMESSGARLFVGGVNSSEVWASEDGNPVRFLKNERFLSPGNVDPTSAVRDTFAGEPVTKIKKVSGHVMGVDPIYVFTRTKTYRLDGIDAYSLSRPTTIGSFGTQYGGAVAEYNGTLYWVDAELQAWEMNAGSMNPIARGKVDDKLATGTFTNSQAAVFMHRYYLPYKPANQSYYTNALLYENRYGEWVEDSYAAGDAAGFLVVDNTSVRNLYMFSDAGHVYQLENTAQTTDDGTPIPVTITTPEFSSGYWTNIVCKRFGVLADSVTGTLTFTRTFKPKASGDGVNGTMNLSTANPYAFLYEKGTGSVLPGGSGMAMYATITGTLPGNTRVYSLVVELAETGDARPNASA